MGQWWHEQGPKVSRGTCTVASSTQGCSQDSDNTKAPRLIIVYEHGTHSMGHCPSLINEMMMLTGVFSLLHPVACSRCAKYPPDHQFLVPLSDNCLWKDGCVWQSWVKGADVCVVKAWNNQLGNKWPVCLSNDKLGSISIPQAPCLPLQAGV